MYLWKIRKQRLSKYLRDKTEKFICSYHFLNSWILAGESIAISAEFQNGSARRIKPRATLYQRTTFFADGKSRSVRNAVAGLQGNTIRGRRTENWTNKLLKIPPITPTLTNCGIIKLEYFLTVSRVFRTVARNTNPILNSSAWRPCTEPNIN